MTTTLDRDVDGYGSLNIRRFCEFPEEQRTPENAKLWLLHKISRDSEPLNACYQEIPLELRSFGVMMAAAKNGLINILDGLDANQTPGYVMLAEAVTRRNYKSITSVHPDYLCQVLPEYCWTHISDVHKIAKEFDWFRGALERDVFDKCCMNIDFALDSPIEQVSDEILEEMMVKNYSSYEVLRSRRLFGLMADRISINGDWPEEVSDLAFAGVKPKSLEDGVNWIAHCTPGKDHETLYMAYVMTYPIEQVVPAMRGKRLKKLLLEMYSPKELKPFLKADRELSGLMLEDGLGL
jgi:hypothetical protein